LTTLAELQEEAEALCGKPDVPPLREDVFGLVTWVDGTVIDALRRPETSP